MHNQNSSACGCLACADGVFPSWMHPGEADEPFEYRADSKTHVRMLQRHLELLIAELRSEALYADARMLTGEIEK